MSMMLHRLICFPLVGLHNIACLVPEEPPSHQSNVIVVRRQFLCNPHVTPVDLATSLKSSRSGNPSYNVMQARYLAVSATPCDLNSPLLYVLTEPGGSAFVLVQPCSRVYVRKYCFMFVVGGRYLVSYLVAEDKLSLTLSTE